MTRTVYRLIGEKGRLYLPQDMREALGVKQGDFVKLTSTGTLVEIQKVHLIELNDHSPEAVEEFVSAATITMSRSSQVELAFRILEQLKMEVED